MGCGGVVVAGGVVTGAVGVTVVPVPGPLGPAACVLVVGLVAAGGGVAPLGATTTGAGALVFALPRLPDGSSVDGMVSTVIAGLATGLGVP